MPLGQVLQPLAVAAESQPGRADGGGGVVCDGLLRTRLASLKNSRAL
jgi:hypothetical protein